MDPKISALERAFAVARSGRPASVAEIAGILRKEGYPLGSLEGPVLRKQLKTHIKQARERAAQQP